MKINNNKGITLVALVITIVVLIILAAISIPMLTGDNGIITKAIESSFRAEMSSLKERIDINKMNVEMLNMPITSKFTEQVMVADVEDWDVDLKKEIIYWGQYQVNINKITRDYAKEHWREILASAEDPDKVSNLYYVDAETADGREHTYVYDTFVGMVYKIKPTKIGKYIVHSIEELDYQIANGNKERDVIVRNIISADCEMVTVDDISYYEPDLSGFILEKTSLVYYAVDEDDSSNDSSIIVPAQEYLAGNKKRTITKDDKEYELYNYNKKIWANILVENEGVQSYWVWIPRYTYQVGEETIVDEVKTRDISIKFIDLNGTPEDGYMLHPAFEDGKKGIWVSKYEPILNVSTKVEDFPYYTPDMSGFDKENTYIELYDETTQEFKEKKLGDIDNLTLFARNNNWFDYQKKIWANIKVVNPDTKLESWWVWIPRYAYNITGEITSILFIDTNNNPLIGGKLPNNYVVHPAFGDDRTGIWVSKYEPVQTIQEKEKTNDVNPPDLTGYNVDNTYIMCYDEENKTFKEGQTLRSVLTEDSVIDENQVAQVAKIDKSKLNGTWYSYDKQIWANIKVVNPETKLESWWVWIPRYAYNIMGVETDIIFLDGNGNPRTGSELPSNFIPHPAFNDKTGIWASKYEPIETNN